MNPRDRYLGAIRGEKVDRVPLHIAGFESVPWKVERFDADDPLRRELVERFSPHMHYDVTHSSRINRMLVTPQQFIKVEEKTLPDGCRQTRGWIDTPKGELTYEMRFDPDAGTGWQVKYPVETEADLLALASVPWELPERLSPPDRSDLPEDFDRRGVYLTRISSPFVCVAAAMKYEQFLGMTATHADLIADLTQMCLDRTMACLEVLFSEPGIEYVWLGGSEWVTPPMGAPRIYDALVQEQERRIIDYIHGVSDAVVHVHCHGKVRDALPKVIDRGADYFEPCEGPPDGDITLAEAKQVAAGRIALGGNVQCRVLCNESEERTEAAVRTAFEGGKERFVLRTTEGPSPRLSEREYRNYLRVFDVWQELSPIG